jgi:hypothetical protein
VSKSHAKLLQVVKQMLRRSCHKILTGAGLYRSRVKIQESQAVAQMRKTVHSYSTNRGVSGDKEGLLEPHCGTKNRKHQVPAAPLAVLPRTSTQQTKRSRGALRQEGETEGFTSTNTAVTGTTVMTAVIPQISTQRCRNQWSTREADLQ